MVSALFSGYLLEALTLHITFLMSSYYLNYIFWEGLRPDMINILFTIMKPKIGIL